MGLTRTHPKKGAYDNMGLIMVSFEIFLLERHFDRKKDPENVREMLLSTDRLSNHCEK